MEQRTLSKRWLGGTALDNDMLTILGLSSWNLLFMKETEIRELGLALVKNFDLRPDVLS